MRNCKIVDHACVDLSLDAVETVLKCEYHAEDGLLCAASSLGNVIIFDVSTSLASAPCLFSFTIPGADDGDKVACLAFCAENDAFVFGTMEGALYTMAVDTGRVEEVGAFDSAVLVLEVSPDGQMIAIITASGKLLLMNQHWEVEGETPLQMAMENQLPVVQEDTVQLSEGSVSLSWRGDCQIFCTVSRATDEPAATLRVWSPVGCTLQHCGDADADEAQALEPVVAWQPNGRHIYCSQAMGTRRRMCLFERNGLGHGSFLVQDDDRFHIYQAIWSPDSMILAIAASCGEDTWTVQLWQRRNWHWYQLNERRWTGEGPIHITWSDIAPATLLVLSSSGCMERWGLSMAVDVSERGTAAVIEGAAVLLTPFRHTVIPPPLCAARVMVPSPVRAVAWGEHDGCECLAIMHATGVCLARSVEADLWEETAEEAAEGGPGAPDDGVIDGECIAASRLQLPAMADAEALHACTHVCWMRGDVLVAVVPQRRHSCEGAAEGDAAIALTLRWPDGEVGEVAVVRCDGCNLGSAVVAVAATGDGAMVAQTVTGDLLRVCVDGTGVTVGQLGRLPEPCRHMLVHSAAGEGVGGLTVYGISDVGKLCIGGEVAATDVSSACVRRWGPGGAYLLFTTNSQLLHTVPLTGSAVLTASGSGGAAGPTSTQGKEASAVGVRAIEAGAQLVAAPAGTAMAVLQMPRGNLEGVHVRALTLASVTERLMRQEYRGAMAEAAAQRVDLNLLVDFRWPAFLQQAAEFVRQVEAGALCDVLTALRPENCLAVGERYSGALPAAMQEAHVAEGAAAAEAQRGADAGPDPGDKVNSVCAAVRQHALRTGGRHVQAAVMSYVRMQPPELESAVDTIRTLKEQELADPNAAPDSDAADALAKFLLLHVDAEQAYRAALGRYDLRTAYLIISVSQKDPAEYLLELQGFHAITDTALRHHHIDAKLGRHERALQHAVDAGAVHHATARQYACEHGLLRNLLELLRGQPELREAVLRVYAEQLEASGKLADAAVAYLACSAHEAAVRCYTHAGEWQMAFALLLQSARDAAPVRQLAEDLIEQLCSTGRPAEAGTVAETYLRDGERALQLYIEAGEWRRALAVVGQVHRSGGAEAALAPAAATAATTQLADVRADAARALKYSARLQALRSKRLQMAETFGETGGEGRDELADGSSDVVTLATDMSAYTDRSVAAESSLRGSGQSASTVGGHLAQRSKKQRGRGKIRQGTPEEEQKLAVLLCDLAPTPELCSQTSQLAELLVYLGHADDAATLQDGLDGYVKGFVAAAEDILGNPSPPANGSQKAEEDAVKTVLQIQIKLQLLRRASWKWDLLRQVK